ncbi:hypothetical protein [Teredinibacter sp. KSP-S5-2]|uniref:hypothetical protein n=1 Tax=Teredinibacter sp. KSP-S5-2 TaxID=3034506 RepID=UPI0029342703|nr:hypothetical protein [Teredinibacter sp. KSP-S5-2]WNO11482.1 hypothetical protein P5V12_09890 [Teredinibacter sp. KSP-S5-2]
MKYLLLIGFVLSQAVSAYDGLSGVTTVEYIYSPVDGSLPYVQFGDNSMSGCHDNNGGYLPVTNVEGGERTYSLLLAAYMSKSPVAVYYKYVNTDPNYNGWGKCHILAVDLR